MTLTKRQLWILALVLGAMILITLFAAPSGNPLQRGSTYSRSPDGYGAWYASMQQQGITIQRWQKPLKSLLQPDGSQPPAIETMVPPSPQLALTATSPVVTTIAGPITLIQISNGLQPVSPPPPAWISQGHVAILLGVQSPVSNAPFSSTIASPVGAIRLDTSRRASPEETESTPLLSDAYGPVVWQHTIGKGRVILASAPYLAANAYQTAPGNFAFLSQLVTQAGHPVWVDEFSHGYKDPEIIHRESGNLLGYLAKTPLALIAMQAIVLLLVLIWGHNQRFGPAIALVPPTVNNSEAYIQAMAGVLQKAECSDFVVDTVTKAEQIDIQKALGFGLEPLTQAALVTAWTQQTGRPAAELAAALQPPSRQRRLRDADFTRWIEAMQAVRHYLPAKIARDR